MKRGNEVTVGILITVAVVVLVAGGVYLAHGGLSSGYPIYTRFLWGQNLKQGQPVLLAGVSVGYVDDVELRPGYLDVTLRVNNKYHVPKGSKTSVVPVGIFGDVAIGFTPPTPLPTTSYAPGDTAPSGPPAVDLNQLMGRVDSIGVTVQGMANAVNQQVIEAGTFKDLHKLVAATAEASAQLHGILIEQNKNVSALLDSTRASVTRLGHAVDSAKVAATIDSLQLLMSNGQRFIAHLDSTNAQLQALIQQAKNPNGTLGKLLTDSSMYTDMRRLIQQTDSLLEDFRKNPKKYINVHIL